MRACLSLAVVFALLAACDGSGQTSGGAGGTGGAGAQGGAAGSGGSAGSGGGGTGGACGEPVPCEDEVILQMAFNNTPAPGLIDEVPDGSGFATHVDAVAGGAMNPDPDAFVYGKFTDTGLVKVDIDDEASLGSADWDIAFRRYIIRINSGHSGPSCVLGTRVPGDPDYDTVTAVPDPLPLQTDEYFTATCELIPDGSGLPDSPATALSSFWTYTGCLAMTGYTFVLQLADGRYVKLTVTNYYDDAAQAQCDAMGTVPMPSGSGNIKLRWAFLPG